MISDLACSPGQSKLRRVHMMLAALVSALSFAPSRLPPSRAVISARMSVLPPPPSHRPAPAAATPTPPASAEDAARVFTCSFHH
mmetsp:Transcript_28866/g.86056  ORF Transcript_28866/g.86056 Transcript_28866/m.86056 type:complete len:84 (-) Transcript_28866:1572-1823(-)